MEDKLPKIGKVETSLLGEDSKRAEQVEASISRSIRELRESFVGGIGSLVELSASEMSPDEKVALAKALEELTKVISTAMKKSVMVIAPEGEDLLEIPSGEHPVIEKSPEDKPGIAKAKQPVPRIAG